MRDQSCSAKALSACVQCTDRPLSYLVRNGGSSYIDIALFCCFAIVTKLFQLVSTVLPKYHDLSRASVSRACGREIALAHSVRALNFPNAEGQKAQTQSSNRPAEPDKV